ncbi:MAG TPA: hypothetical protein VGK10_12035 [Prolixibacteraceae bacterium]|jgi:hypothetical protein
MKQVVFALMLSIIFIACMDEATQTNEVQITDLKEHNMKIIPENPASGDQIKLVVLDDCKYNVLKGIEINGKSIEIEKQYNSMIKWPCFQTNDTILIGKLSEGTYVVNYRLIDVSTQVSNHIALSFYFNLVVAQ